MLNETEKKKINCQMFYNKFVETLEELDRNSLIKMDDDELEEYVFDEIGGKIYAWLSPEHIVEMQQTGFISPMIGMEASMIHMLFSSIEQKETSFMNAHSVRNNLGPWQMIFTYVDKIMEEIKK